MNYKKLIAATIGLTLCAFTGSNAMAHGGGGGGRGGGGFGGGGFHGGGFGGSGFHGGFAGGGFRSGFRDGGFRGAGFSRGFRGNRFGHRGFDDRFFFFGDFGDSFFYYPYSYYGYYPYGDYPYGYGYGSYDLYNSYNQPVYQSSDRYTGSLIREVQLRLARGGYYYGAIDGMSGSATRRAIRQYEHAHALPEDGRIGQRLLTTMGVS